MALSYKPGVPHLNLANYDRPDTKVSAEAIVSGPQNLKGTESSWPRYLDCPPVPNLIKNPDGSYKLRRVTASNPDRFEITLRNYLENGNFSAQIDDANKYDPNSFKTWRDAGEKNSPNLHEYVKLPPENAGYAMVSLSERRAEFPINHTALPKYVHDEERSNRRINYKGKEESWLENRRQDLINFLRTKEAQELIDYLRSVGLSPEDIDYIVVGSLPPNAIYAVDKTEDGEVMLIASYNAHELIAKAARSFGIKLEDYKHLGLAEEIAHIWRRDVDKLEEGYDLIALEMGAKEAVTNAYSILAKGAEGDPRKVREVERLRKLRDVKYIDWLTTPSPERYGRRLFYKQLYSKDRATLEYLLTQEAIEQGYEGKEVKEYVASRLKEIGDKAEGKDSKPQSKSRLEKIVEKEADSKETPREVESKETPREIAESESSEASSE